MRWICISCLLLALPAIGQEQISVKAVQGLTQSWQWAQPNAKPDGYRIFKRTYANSALGPWRQVDDISYDASLAQQKWTHTSPQAEVYQIYVEAYLSAQAARSKPSALLSVMDALDLTPGQPVNTTTGTIIIIIINGNWQIH